MVGCLTMSIDITGIDKVELLKLLWNNSKPAVFYAFSGTPAPLFNDRLANESINGYIHYFQGRLIKLDL